MHFAAFGILLVLFSVLMPDVNCVEDLCRSLNFRSDMAFDGKRLINHVIRTIEFVQGDICEMLCFMEHNCVSYNVEITSGSTIATKCELNNSTHNEHPVDLEQRNHYIYRGTENPCGKNPCSDNAICQVGFTDKGYQCLCLPGFSGQPCEAISGYFSWKPGQSCSEIRTIEGKQAVSGEYWLNNIGTIFQAYCHMESAGQEWTLIARFSNIDNKNWMEDTGHWWYDKNFADGETDPSSNTDMISPAFWLVSGNEFKITRSDDPQHTSLLQTTCDCLGGQTFRSKITGYGDFSNGATWRVNNRCLGNCTVQYGGQYETTNGFIRAKCNGTIQSADKIGFWCDRGTWDGAVIMIGGSGTDACGHTHHGIGVTAAYVPSFLDIGRSEFDFGDYPFDGYFTNAYSLNLWIR